MVKTKTCRFQLTLTQGTYVQTHIFILTFIESKFGIEFIGKNLSERANYGASSDLAEVIVTVLKITTKLLTQIFKKYGK